MVYLVYAVNPQDSSEPLIAIVDSEEQAIALERQLSPVRVRWEEHTVPEGAHDELFIIFLAAGGDTSDAELTDPIGDHLFVDHQEAVRHRDQRNLSGVGHFVVRSYPSGWRRAGWPFA
ncbi:hypothetical protein [Janibacter sp. G1551]|uniref:hypothetical protein n=1 Tax=Janibacter sp. G1551 TaxID=3420440 RepID=UPI003D05FF8D